MDSSGIGVILNRYKQMEGSSGTVAVYGAGERMRRILRIGGVYRLVQSYRTREEALDVDIKGEMNMYADDISVSETEVKGKLKKIKNSEEYRKFEQNEQRQAEKNGTWMHLEIDSHSSNEEFARVTAAVFMSRMNPTMEELEDVKTAVSEAVTNAVIHGYSDEIGIIYIEARIEGEELIISVRDEGKGILDVEKAMEPMYTTDTTGERSGMGFSFMEAFMVRSRWSPRWAAERV